jgi:pyrroline-5-carboxylate reductase
MPNLAARINKSPVILAARGLDAGAREGVFALFDALGSVVPYEVLRIVSAHLRSEAAGA